MYTTPVFVNTCNSYHNDLFVVYPNVTHCRSLSSYTYVIAEDDEFLMQLCWSCQLKDTKQNKTKKRKPKQEFIYYKRSGEGFTVKNICCVLLPAATSLKMPIVKKTSCVLLPLSFMMSFKMKICCVLLPASWWRRYSCVLLVHLLCTFINVFIKNYASGAKSRAVRVCMSGTCYQ